MNVRDPGTGSVHTGSGVQQAASCVGLRGLTLPVWINLESVKNCQVTWMIQVKQKFSSQHTCMKKESRAGRGTQSHFVVGNLNVRRGILVDPSVTVQNVTQVIAAC